MEHHKKVSLLKLIGRISLSAIFIMGGVSKITGFSGSVGYATAFGVPLPEIAIIIAIVVELVGGVMILFGYKTKLASLTIAIFLIPVTLIFHNDFGNQLEMVAFMKNLAIFGGLLYVAVGGAGAYSLDHKQHGTQEMPAA